MNMCDENETELGKRNDRVSRELRLARNSTACVLCTECVE